ncbi:MAG TPA: hypothetical protein VM888_13805 [Chitinophagaceae bacterium]|jgi:hypothetical protein|nr:hypothetical protein [Chitinophagaceae bacterium]
MDKFNSIELGTAKSEECAKCGMQKADSDGCCHDEVKVVQLQQDVRVVAYSEVDFSIAPIILPITHHLQLPFYNFILSKEKWFPHPPLLSKQDSHVTNCVFLI